METFCYVIKDAIGIHARPAGLLTKEAKKFQSKVSLIKDGRAAEATRLMAVMGLGVKCGDTVEIKTEGPDEAEAAEAMQKFFEENL